MVLEGSKLTLTRREQKAALGGEKICSTQLQRLMVKKGRSQCNTQGYHTQVLSVSVYFNTGCGIVALALVAPPLNL